MYFHRLVGFNQAFKHHFNQGACHVEQLQSYLGVSHRCEAEVQLVAERVGEHTQGVVNREFYSNAFILGINNVGIDEDDIFIAGSAFMDYQVTPVQQLPFCLVTGLLVRVHQVIPIPDGKSDVVVVNARAATICQGNIQDHSSQ